jgi:DNA-binding transcriptional LysR family regulator
MLRKMDTVSQVQALREGRIDVGFLLPGVDDGCIVIKPAWEEDMVIAMPEKHHLARGKSIPLRALAGEPYIMFSQHMRRDYHNQIVDFFRSIRAAAQCRS